MRLPDLFRCDWPACQSTDTTKVTIVYDGQPKVHADLCGTHVEPLAEFIAALPLQAANRTARSLEEFIVAEKPSEE